MFVRLLLFGTLCSIMVFCSFLVLGYPLAPSALASVCVGNIAIAINCLALPAKLHDRL